MKKADGGGDRSASKLTSVRIPLDIAERIERAAAAERRSLSNFLVTAAAERADRVLGVRK